MFNLLNYPIVLCLLVLGVMWLATRLGASVTRRQERLEGVRDDFGTIVGATLTLLGLIIGFTFSMATTRYDQRKNLEEEEANAIGTEYVRADLLPPSDAARVRTLLKQYTDLRIRFYGARDQAELRQINDQTGQLQNQLWAAA